MGEQKITKQDKINWIKQYVLEMDNLYQGNYYFNAIDLTGFREDYCKYLGRPLEEIPYTEEHQIKKNLINLLTQLLKEKYLVSLKCYRDDPQSRDYGCPRMWLEYALNTQNNRAKGFKEFRPLKWNWYKGRRTR